MLYRVFQKLVPLLYKSVLSISVRLNLVRKTKNKSCDFQSNSIFSYLLCYLLTRIFDLCTAAPKVRVREYIFQSFFCLYFIARIAQTPSLFFVNIKKDKHL